MNIKEKLVVLADQRDAALAFHTGWHWCHDDDGRGDFVDECRTRRALGGAS